MQEQSSPDTPGRAAGRLWSPRAIFWVGVLLSFVFAGVMQAKNFGRLNQPKKKRTVLLSSIAGFLVLFFLIPDRPSVTAQLYLLTVNGILSYKISRMHLIPFVQYLDAGLKPLPAGRTALVLLSGALLLLALITAKSAVSVMLDERRFDAGLSLMERGDYAGAEKIFLAYAAQFPEETAAYWNLAIVYEETGRIDDAIRQITLLLREDPDDEEALDFLEELQDLNDEELQEEQQELIVYQPTANSFSRTGKGIMDTWLIIHVKTERRVLEDQDGRAAKV